MKDVLQKIKGNIAESLKAVRISKNLTQDKLAEKANLSLDFIIRCESGLVSLSHCAASKLAIALEVELGDISPIRKGEEIDYFVNWTRC